MQPPESQQDLFLERRPDEASGRDAGIEHRYDIAFTAELALKEKQIQQNIRPIIAVHKWFARRPGTLFRSLLLSEFATRDPREAFFASNDLSGIRVADPFMGGGTPLIEANRLGMDVQGWDVNPMAYWIVQEAMRDLDTKAYSVRAEETAQRLATAVGHLYRTACPACDGTAQAKYFIWIKRGQCRECGQLQTLYPGSTIALAGRHPRNVFVCQECGEVHESGESTANCPECGRASDGPSRVIRGAWVCGRCTARNELPPKNARPMEHELVAIEVHCSGCSTAQRGRLYKKPDGEDQERLAESRALLASFATQSIPDEEIPAGDETDRLHRWGYRRYRELFNERQLLGLETLAAMIREEPDDRLAAAFATNLSDLVRYQNLLCRYDTKALKSLDVFSVHGFPVGLVQCESNLLGIRRARTGTLVGSGGWLNISTKYLSAKRFCERPFETKYRRKSKVTIPTLQERIGARSSDGRRIRKVELYAGSSTEAELAPASLDAVVTDPPYFANVQYAELMDFCYVWLRRLVREESGAFERNTTRNASELTGNITLGRGLAHFTEGLSLVFARFADALRPGRPFVFTYHHNKREAYDPIVVALLDARLVVTRALPCPAEMGGSIHIQGTGSSILDSVFVCRRTGRLSRRALARDAPALRAVVRMDLLALREAGIRPTRGDAKCLAFGHIARVATWALRESWHSAAPAPEKLRQVGEFAETYGDWAAIVTPLAEELGLGSTQRWDVLEPAREYDEGECDDISF